MSELDELLSVLQDRTDESFDATSFDSRLRIQKAVYLVQAAGETVDRRYSYSNYFHGPYSPGLAREYYHEDEPSVSIREEASSPIPENVLSTVEDAVKHERGTEFLEAVATVHSVASRNATAEMGTILTVAERLKPRFSREFLEVAWEWVADKGLLDWPTSTRES